MLRGTHNAASTIPAAVEAVKAVNFYYSYTNAPPHVSFSVCGANRNKYLGILGVFEGSVGHNRSSLPSLLSLRTGSEGSELGLSRSRRSLFSLYELLHRPELFA